jgi:hypothetical protein
MKRISAAQVGILQGSRVMFSDFADGGPMWTAAGDRESRHEITFDTAFLEPPSVMVSLAMWDVDHKHNGRMDLRAERITATGFDLVFRTWQDSRVARVRADWLAIGPVRDDEDWDVT